MDKHDDIMHPLTLERCHEEMLAQRHEPGFRYCVDAVDNAFIDANRVERLALVEYCVKLYGDATIAPPPRPLLFCDNTPKSRKLMQEIAEELNEIAQNFEARMRGVANPGNERDERKEAAR